jgi:hypothetical protein
MARHGTAGRDGPSQGPGPAPSWADRKRSARQAGRADLGVVQRISSRGRRPGPARPAGPAGPDPVKDPDLGAVRCRTSEPVRGGQWGALPAGPSGGPSGRSAARTGRGAVGAVRGLEDDLPEKDWVKRSRFAEMGCAKAARLRSNPWRHGARRLSYAAYATARRGHGWVGVVRKAWHAPGRFLRAAVICLWTAGKLSSGAELGDGGYKTLRTASRLCVARGLGRRLAR